MSKATRKAEMAAALAALQYGIQRNKAKDLLLFWLDAEAINPNDTIEKMARTVRDAMIAAGSISEA